MIANVTYAGPLTRGTVRGMGDSDTYVFDLAPAKTVEDVVVCRRWKYQGKVHADVFIPAGVQGYEHIPQEFYHALDQAWVTDSPVEFPDPFLDDLMVQGS